MEIISEFVREQKRYAKNDLSEIFRLSSGETETFIKNLKAFGVLKSVKGSTRQRELSDLVDEDIEIVDVISGNDDYFYVFTYVGVITIGSRIIKCYPKYLLSEDKPLSEMKQILKVISKYGSKEQIINLFNGDGDLSSFNILAVILFLLNDYHEYGIYNNTEDIIEVNGEGEILWDKTISDGFAIISNNRPYYIELYTKKTVDDEHDFFKQLHECILTECSDQLKDSGLLELFDMTEVSLTDDLLDSLGDTNYILYRLESELNVQFNTRKQILLKTIYAYVAHKRTLQDSYGISMYGTNSFNLVWEDVCSEVFDNKLHSAIEQLELPVPVCEEYKSNNKLIDIIERPIWTGIDTDGGMFNKTSSETLIPDLVTISYQDEKMQFLIFDAKYYNINLEKGQELRGNPGVGDVTKQYLYQLAYKRFISDHQIEVVKNCFLMPTEDNKIVKKGRVKMDMLSNLGLQDIQIRLLPAEMMYNYYLSNEIMDVSILELD
ncbi:LlaJI family restriction endonuclease [Sedimentibacter sp. MB31-C6]|uniref:LlaJI family restriction endonuclease n=1 Tax=Sedimentibacter sp. MB31-C6 TaxID=3109366 RepID=UPI002DDD1456|nr:LlaJI family restriction endonuclease [Sedimentibacter sp. MB36-C1]WSI03171.1 LlaJI family restriction endonuclease [Sedimentibacter sp. MB36-C1]